MTQDWIVINGAREHNLRNLTVRLPRNRLSVITGLSGSGKSSLAFDTLFAEGQRRYVESLSPYVRQFLDQMSKPDVDSIEGLSPAISIEQRSAAGTPRSIVATTTDIHDYLRLLWAHAGIPHCPRCSRPVSAQSAAQIVRALLELPAGAKLTLLSPLVRGRKGAHLDRFDAARRQGFVRARVDGTIADLDDLPALDKRKAHTIEIVVDRLVSGENMRARLADSVELALRHGEGVLVALWQSSGAAPEERVFAERLACAECGISFAPLTARHFSFNSPHGACPHCSGLGVRLVPDPELVVPDRTKPLQEAIPAWRRGGRRMILYYRWVLKALAQHYGVELSTPFSELPESFLEVLWHGSGTEPVAFGRGRGANALRREKPFEGLLPNLERRYLETESESFQALLRTYMRRQACDVCHGARLKPEALAVTVDGLSLAAFLKLSVRDALSQIDGMPLSENDRRVVGNVIREVHERLSFLQEVGLDYLTLDRESATLSGGESQRIRLATQIGSHLTGVLYVLDEPSIGLHHRDNQRLLRTLERLRDSGNTVVVVEHDRDTIQAADYVVDLGPGAGRLGGELLFQGPPAELARSGTTATARYLRGELGGPTPARKAPDKAWITVVGARANNLKNVTVRFPLGLLIGVTGVSGSGKSTLVDDILRRAAFIQVGLMTDPPGEHDTVKGLQQIDQVVEIDQSPIGRTPRSNPATYSGAFDLIRELFSRLPAAKVRGYAPGRFSFNVKGGRCESCKGDGMRRLEMHFLPDVYVPCEECEGKRYNPETLEMRYAGRTIAEVLALTVDEALPVFEAVPRIARRLRAMEEVGLGYVALGQAATTLSGGEAQRLKLASELARPGTGRTLYLLDEPTTGLHAADVERLVTVLERLRNAGNTVLVIEHNLDVIRRADYLIDLGPEGGDAGGQVVVTGTPEVVAACPTSHTGAALRNDVARGGM